MKPFSLPIVSMLALLAGLSLVGGAIAGRSEGMRASPESVRDGSMPAERANSPERLTLRRAIRRVRATVEVPARLPDVPRSAGVERLFLYPEANPPHAHVELSRGLHLQYGRGGFDGCPGNVGRARVAGRPAMIAYASPPPSNRHPYSVIWPARRVADRRAVYGLSFRSHVATRTRLLHLAASMHPRVPIPRAVRERTGC